MNSTDQSRQHQLARILLSRLEKISADSPWAHRASGVRASLAKLLARGHPSQENSCRGEQLAGLLSQGFEILEKAAGQIPAEDLQNGNLGKKQQK